MIIVSRTLGSGTLPGPGTYRADVLLQEDTDKWAILQTAKEPRCPREGITGAWWVRVALFNSLGGSGYGALRRGEVAVGMDPEGKCLGVGVLVIRSSALSCI